MDDKARLIERIRKLLALSASPNENEAASAAAKAQALLAEHQLHISEVQGDSNKVEEFELRSALETESRPWCRNIVSGIAKLYFCSYFYTHKYNYTARRSCGYVRTDTHTIVGAAHNIEVAQMMAKYLLDTVERLAKEASLSQPVKKRTTFITSFKHACAGRLGWRLHERLQAAKRGEVKKVMAVEDQSSHDGEVNETSTNLPALANLYESNDAALKNFIQKTLGELGKGRKATYDANSAGAHAGRKAADSISLDAQIGGTRAGGSLQKPPGHLLGKG